jgi:hypothetical protein
MIVVAIALATALPILPVRILRINMTTTASAGPRVRGGWVPCGAGGGGPGIRCAVGECNKHRWVADVIGDDVGCSAHQQRRLRAAGPPHRLHCRRLRPP